MATKNTPAVEQEGEVDPAETSVGPEAGSAPAAPAKAKAGQEAPAKASKSSLIVRVPGNVPSGPPGGFHRVFSKEEHGDDFKGAAEQYRKRFNGEYVDSLPAPKVCPACKRAF